jgi:hypothetical protein
VAFASLVCVRLRSVSVSVAATIAACVGSGFLASQEEGQESLPLGEFQSEQVGHFVAWSSNSFILRKMTDLRTLFDCWSVLELKRVDSTQMNGAFTTCESFVHGVEWSSAGSFV